MWSVTTSDGQNVSGIRREEDARRTIHRAYPCLTRIGVYSWSGQAIDGHSYTVQLRRQFN